jgi:hypothetical protein
MDLLQRNISKRKDKLKMRAELALNEIFKGKPPGPDVLAENFEREVNKLRLKVCSTMVYCCQCLSLNRSRRAWHHSVQHGNLPK